ncbi:hypothetical protein VP01_501g2 [Puccinia sorghi]|uniref:Uncharacterized protein n=1 Tax=Puccinia sorghi TaxID=27349 RepID=A0A0L6UMF0_9BASI|nr:hypothetical protein VP01_501g2 [Puccinia sorghi]
MGLINLNEDTKERVNQVTGVIKKTDSGLTFQTILHWTWIPIVLTIGFKNSNPKPSMIKYVPPPPDIKPSGLMSLSRNSSRNIGKRFEQRRSYDFKQIHYGQLSPSSAPQWHAMQVFSEDMQFLATANPF